MILRSLASKRDSFFRSGLVLLCISFYSLAIHGQGIKGVVTESFSHAPVMNATVHIIFPDSIDYTVTTNAKGEYTWTTKKAGRARIEVAASGFHPTMISDILFDGYAVQQLSFALEKSSFPLAGVTVVASQNNPVPFVRTITPEDALRVAGNFEDPVRIAHSEPGIVLLNDQTNHLSARGQAPIFNTWYLEGLNIVNPNHTSNAGTLSDLPTQYGGGVNMFAAQTLGNTNIYMGVNPLHINTTSGAAFDMHLHESAEPEWRAKAGLLGFELGGGTALGKQSVLDFNLRYSFTGLLTDLGADFGGEKIKYSDAVVSFRNEGEKHKLKLFAWAGRSTNEFERAEEPEDYKDFFDIDYANDILGVGGRYDLYIGSRANLKTGIAYSRNDSEYSKFGGIDSPGIVRDQDVTIGIASMFAEMSFNLSPFITTSLGLNYTTQHFKAGEISNYYKEEVTSIRPYLSAQFKFGSKWKMTLGGEMQDGNSDEAIFGYRVQVDWDLSKYIQLYAGWRHAPNLPTQYIHFVNGVVHLLSDTYEIGWKYTRENHAIRINLYRQQMNRHRSFYIYEGHYEYLADFPNSQYAGYLLGSRKAVSRHIGAEGRLDVHTRSGWVFTLNQSVYKSERGMDDSSLETGRYNGSYATHFSISKEVLKQGDKNKFWNFSLRGIWNGGLFEPAIDTSASTSPFYDYPVNYNQKLPDFFRIDLGVTRTIARSKIRWRYTLDIQNVFGITNIAYHYYDPYLKEVVPQNQLGLIPVLSVQASW